MRTEKYFKNQIKKSEKIIEKGKCYVI